MPTERGEELLFEELMQRHVDVVFHVARSFTGDEREAEALTQTTFVKAYRAFSRFRVGTNFKAWVLAILRNAYLDERRRRAREPRSVPLERLPREAEPEASPPQPGAIDIESREIFYDVFGDEVARLLRGLPEVYQLPVLLVDVEGLSYEEVAEVLGCPKGTVRSRLHRGRALLEGALAGYARKLGYLREPSA